MGVPPPIPNRTAASYFEAGPLCNLRPGSRDSVFESFVMDPLLTLDDYTNFGGGVGKDSLRGDVQDGERERGIEKRSFAALFGSGEAR